MFYPVGDPPTDTAPTLIDPVVVTLFGPSSDETGFFSFEPRLKTRVDTR